MKKGGNAGADGRAAILQSMEMMGNVGLGAGDARPSFEGPGPGDAGFGGGADAAPPGGDGGGAPEVATEAAFGAYRSEFLCARPIRHRTTVNVDEETLRILRHVLADLGVAAELSMGNFIDNILLGHLRAHRELINRVAAELRRDVTIPE